MAINTDDIIQLTAGGGNSSTQVRWMVTSSWKVTTPGPNASDEYEWVKDAAVAFIDEFETYIMPLVSDSFYLIAGRAQRLYPARSVIGIAPNDTVGGAAGAPPEPNSAVLCSFYTAKPGHRGRGRVYLPPPPTTDAPGGLLTLTDAGQWDLACQAVFLADLTFGGASITPVVFSLADWEDSPVQATATAVIEDVAVDRVLRRQSRRDYRFPQFIGGSE